MVKLLIQNLSLGDKHICIQMNTISCLFGMQIQKHELGEELLELNGLRKLAWMSAETEQAPPKPELQLSCQRTAALRHPK